MCMNVTLRILLTFKTAFLPSVLSGYNCIINAIYSCI